MTTELSTIPLAERWHALRHQQPHLRIRDAAAALGATELDLVATTIGATARWLDPDAAALLHGLPAVGRCMALTRNAQAVSEVRGRYGGVALTPHVGQVVGDGIDLRVFPARWRYAVAIDQPAPQRPGTRQRSVQVFDDAGAAVHKIYLDAEHGDLAAWEALVAARAAAVAPTVVVTPSTPATEVPDAEIDRAAFLAGWDGLRDTHEFFPLISRHRLTRTQALRLAGPTRARPVATAALHLVLVAAAEAGCPIMIFVGNRGCIQIFSGVVDRVRRLGAWLNVLDAGFNLHVREDLLARAWIVAKPTAAGVVQSLEVFDQDGDTVLQIFRHRDDRGAAEAPGWARLLAQLPDVGHGA